MKKLLVAAACCFPLLGGASCNTAEVKTISQVAGGSLTVACTVFNVAKGYFTDRLGSNSPGHITSGNAAILVFASICPPNPPPTDVASALTDLNTAWVALQAATTVPTPAK